MNLSRIYKPKLSILVSIYNVGYYLEKCLSSIISQQYSNLEIILVDSYSTDQSTRICLKFSKIDNRIRYFKIKNQGLVVSRKFALMNSTGEYVTYVDGDDWIERDFSEMMMKKILVLGVDLIVSAFFKDLLDKTYTMYPSYSERIYSKKELIQEIYPRMIFNGNFFEHGISTYLWGKVFRKNLLLSFQNAVPNEVLIGEDSAVVYPYILNSNSIYFLHKPLYHYVQRNNSILKLNYDDNTELSKINSLKLHLEKAIFSDGFNNFSQQIGKYIHSLIILRTGGLLKENHHIRSYFNKNFFNKNIVIYSSGSFGIILKKKIEILNLANIVCWIDDDFSQNSRMNLNVQPFEKVKFIEFDYIVVASIKLKSINDVITKFINLGISPNQIVTIEEDKSNIIDLRIIED
jgi:glycosyltransferase involved in cell wall biosynthesis